MHIRIEKESFKAAYDQAVSDKQEKFTYRKVPFVTQYAKYLLEAMEMMKKESIGVSYKEIING